MSHHAKFPAQGRFVARAILSSLLALTAIASPPHAKAEEEIPVVISPLRIESDPNGVNLVSGGTTMPIPTLSVPGAPHLRFDRVQNAAPYVSGSESGGGESYNQASYSVHTMGGMSESFTCVEYMCSSITGSGSTFIQGANAYWRGTSGEFYRFNLKHVVASDPVSVKKLYYASSVTYPNGEVISFEYETAALPGDTYDRTFYRPIKVSSNLGFFITISYHPGALGTIAWNSPAEAAIYNSSDPTTALARLTYSADGSTITDIGGRVYTCIGCNNSLGSDIEVSSGRLTLPGESSPTIEFAKYAGERVIGTAAKDGVVWNYAYNNLQFHAPTNGYWYDSITVTGPNGYYAKYDMHVVNKRNVIDTITDALNRETSVVSDGNLRPTKITYPEGNSVSVTYGPGETLATRTTTPKPGSGQSAVTETAEYPLSLCDLPGTFDVRCFRPTLYRDGLNRQTDFLYNDHGQMTDRIDPADAAGVRKKTHITYTTTGISRPQVVTVCGDTTTCNTADEIRTEYDYWGDTALPEYVRQIDAARGITLETHNTYDNAGRLKVSDGPLAGTDDATYYLYDQYGRKTWEIGPADLNGKRQAKHFFYRDSDDKVTRVDSGPVTSVSSPVLIASVSTTNTYDNHRNLAVEALSGGGSKHVVTQRSYDDRGRLTCETRRMNPTAFDALPASACDLGTEGSDGPDRITHNVYDNAAQLLKVQRAYGTTLQQDYATYTYTANGQRATIKDANNNLTTLEYDGYDRLKKMRFPVATSGAGQSSTSDYEQYGYDSVGNRTSLRKRDGRTITYVPDNLNRVSSKTVPTSTSGVPGYTVYYGYDVRGLQTYARFSSSSGYGVTNVYDAFGWLRSSTTNMDGVTRVVASDYDAHGNRAQISHPGGVHFDYQYDAANHLIGLSENGSGTPMATMALDDFSRREYLYRNQTASYTQYGYDPIARLNLIEHDLDGSATSYDLSIGFTFNPASQVRTRSQSNDVYEYPIASATQTYTANGLNQYTQITGTGAGTPTYDANGNLTSDGATSPTNYAYDTENRLVTVSGAKSASMVYDPLGRLYQLTAGGSTIRFLYDGDRLIAEYNTSGTALRRYVHGAGVDEPLVWYEGSTVSSSNRRYLHANHQGSIIATSNASGAMLEIATYDAYGLTTAPTGWRFQYTGQTAIPQIGLYYYKARFYNPSLGRFMQVDPIGYEDDNNLYAYVGNDPFNRTDPAGLSCTQVSMGTGTRLGAQFSCKVDYWKITDKSGKDSFIPRDKFTAEQLKSVKPFEADLTHTVNKLAANPTKSTSIKGPGGQATGSISAGKVSERLANARAIVDPAVGADGNNAIMSAGDRYLGGTRVSSLNVGLTMLSSAKFEAPREVYITHEGLHLAAPYAMRMWSGLSREDSDIQHQASFNEAAEELWQ